MTPQLQEAIVDAIDVLQDCERADAALALALAALREQRGEKRDSNYAIFTCNHCEEVVVALSSPVTKRWSCPNCEGGTVREVFVSVGMVRGPERTLTATEREEYAGWLGW